MTAKIVATALALAATLCAAPAQAGILEDLIGHPTIQNLMVKLQDTQTTVRRCTDAAFRQRNLTACEQAEQAARLAAVPAELRAVLAVPASAASLREICLGVQGGPYQNSYLCSELGKADTGFSALANQQRAFNRQQGLGQSPGLVGGETPR